MNKLLIITAPSGAGKTTLVKHLLRFFNELEFSVSACTRNPRLGEIDGRDYYFISAGEFKYKIAGNEFVEYEEVYHGLFYGTLKSEVERIWNKKHVVLFDVDVKGAVNLKKKFGEQAFSIFIKPPSIAVLKERLMNRASETIEKIEERVTKASTEMEFEQYFDYSIVNDMLEKSEIEIIKVVSEFLKK